MGAQAINIEDSIKKYGGSVSSAPSSIEDSIAKYGGKAEILNPQGQKPVEGSAGSRFFGNLGDKTLHAIPGYKSIDEHKRLASDVQSSLQNGDYFAALKIITHEMGSVLPGGNLIADSLHNAIEQGKKAADAFHKGEYTEAAGQAAGAIPIAGQMAAQIGNQMGGSDPTMDSRGNIIQPGQAPDVAGGLGSAAGQALPIAALKAASTPAGQRISAAAAELPGKIVNAATLPGTGDVLLGGLKTASGLGIALKHPSVEGLAVGGYAVDRGIAGIRKGLAKRAAAREAIAADAAKSSPAVSAQPITPEVLPPERQLPTGPIVTEPPPDTSGPIAPKVPRGEPVTIPEARQLGAATEAIITPAPLDASGPIPTDPATGYPLKPGQTPPAAPVSEPVIEAGPAAPTVPTVDPLLNDIAAASFRGKSYAELTPQQQAVANRMADGVRRAQAKTTPAATPAEPVPPVAPQPTEAPAVQGLTPEVVDPKPAVSEPIADTAATLTKGLIDGGIAPEQIADMTLEQWQMAAEALGVKPTLSDLLKARQAAGEAKSGSAVAPPDPASAGGVAVEPAGVTIRKENAPDSIAAPAGAPLFDEPRIMTEEAVKKHATDNGLPYEDTRKQLMADGYSIMNRPMLNRALHAIGSELGLDHETLSQVVRMPYGEKGYKSMAQMSQEEMLAELNNLSEKRAIRAPLPPKSVKAGASK